VIRETPRVVDVPGRRSNESVSLLLKSDFDSQRVPFPGIGAGVAEKSREKNRDQKRGFVRGVSRDNLQCHPVNLWIRKFEAELSFFVSIEDV
jgi:hypothetical protein